MTSFLLDWIIELIFVAVDVLCPVFGRLAAVNPAVVVLGFEDLDAIYGHHKVVNLRAPPGHWNSNVVQYTVLVFRQTIQLPSNHLLSHLPLRGNQPPEQEG